MHECEQELRAVRTKYGYSTYDHYVKRIGRDRLQNPSREKRKPIPRALKAKLYVKQAGRCAECHDPFDISGLEGDHVDPNRQDFNSPHNWQLLCRPCNREKSALSVMQQTRHYGKTATEILNANGE